MLLNRHREGPVLEGGLNMPNRFWWAIFFLLVTVLLDQVVLADMTTFDFDRVSTTRRRHANNFAAIESYMEDVLGSDVSVSRGTTAVEGGRWSLGYSDMSLTGGFGTSVHTSDVYLVNGKGRNSGVVLSFGDTPINSIAVDWEVFRKGTGITIKADGVIIYQDLLSKAEKKTGITGHLSPFYFAAPIHTLEFIGMGKSKIGIDNLVLNVPLASYDAGHSPSGSTFSGGGTGGNGDTGGNSHGGPDSNNDNSKAGKNSTNENGSSGGQQGGWNGGQGGYSGGPSDHNSTGAGGAGGNGGWGGGAGGNNDGNNWGNYQSNENQDSGGEQGNSWHGDYDGYKEGYNDGPYSPQTRHQVPEPATLILFGVGLLVIIKMTRAVLPASHRP